MGVRALSLTAVNQTVGVGIFGLPAVAAAALGPAAVVAYLACAGIIGLVGLCLAEAGSRVSAPGGLYAYAGAAFGPLAASFVGTLSWLGNSVIANAAVGVLLASTIGRVVPTLTLPIPRALFLAGMYAVLAWVNVRAVRDGVGLSVVLTVLKLLPLVLLVLVGLPQVHFELLRWQSAPSIANVAKTTVVLVFAFSGIEGALSASGEVHEPARTIPRAILATIALITVLYIGLQVVAQGILGPALAGAGETPLVSVARVTLGAAGATLLTVAVGLSAAGFLSADVLTGPRVLYALALDGLLPRPLSAVHPTFRTPAVAIVVYAALAALFAISGTFARLAFISAAATLLSYLVCSIGVLRLRSRGIRGEQVPFIVPGGPIVPIVTGVTILALISS
ncbi:MAG: APC family permease, partial [Gemmatimonadota bacterium]